LDSCVLTFAALGPLEVRAAGRLVEVGGRLPRRLLSALIAAQGRAVSDDKLAESVWAGKPPSNPAGALQVYVSRLRRAVPGLVLQRTPTGYQLVVATADTDIEQFAVRTARGRRLASAGDQQAAREAFESALGLWRGEPFADLAGDDDLGGTRATLREHLEAVQEDHAAAALADGADDATAVCEALVQVSPYRERRWVLLALALYRSGRQADALNAIRRIRSLLAAELGVDPGPHLQDLEARMLRQDSMLLTPDRRAAPPTAQSRLSSFVGREADLARLDHLTRTHRFVTIVGPAGAGKTRLAVEYTGASALVRLADITDPSLLAAALAAAMGVKAGAGDPYEAIARELPFHKGPVVLDNCEHLADDVAQFVLTLLAQLPTLRIVATSRVPLHADGEHVLFLAPLSASDAVALLIDRIRAIRSGWTPDPAELSDLRHLAEGLDNLPLALELAAARARTFSIRDLADHLDDRFALLGRVPLGAMTSHKTLHEAIAWSIDLLTEDERRLACQSWPYEGGFPLPAVEGRLGSLASLVDQSVITADTGAPATRYRMLETIRAYCRAIDTHPAATREAHAAWVRDLVVHTTHDLQHEGAAEAMLRLHRELPNIRAALAHDLALAPEQALRTAARLMWFWIRSGLLDEGSRAITETLLAASHADVEDVARAQAALAGLRYVGGDAESARTMLAAAARHIADDDQHRSLFGEIRYYEALVQLPGGDPRLALTAAAEAYTIASEANTAWLLVAAEAAWGAALVLAGSLSQGQQRLRSAADRAATWGYLWTAGLSELMLAQTMLAANDAGALGLLQSALRRFQREDDMSEVLAVLHTGALVLSAASDSAGAAVLRDAVHLHCDRYGIRVANTFLPVPAPPSWYTGTAPDGAPSLDHAATALSEAVTQHSPSQEVAIRRMT
jgi:predicted ATPase/DNA-binding SARP family transcriptional activator